MKLINIKNAHRSGYCYHRTLLNMSLEVDDEMDDNPS